MALPAFHAASHRTCEWHDRQPWLSVKRIDLQAIRNQRAQSSGVDWPVRKEQVVPTLRHRPWSGGQRPGPVRDFLQDGVHVRSQSFLDKLIF